MDDMARKLENTLDVIMEHFSETEDRISELEEQVKRLSEKLE
jgi:polyhydroxyalkanoate synthesis regulator phasin|tara:strand:+ start:242 stop:367 length:126 start_codon:yes stop_codon:yes gene_type:complete